MNTQCLQFACKQLIVTTADLSSAIKSQLIAFTENAMLEAIPHSQSHLKMVNPASDCLINPTSPPIPGQQSRIKGSPIALVQPVEYSTASRCRVVLSLNEHQKIQFLWDYNENVRWENQVSITQRAWTEFKASLGTKKVTEETLDRLKSSIWLAAQGVGTELTGRETCEYQQLAQLAGVAKATRTKTYFLH